MSEFGKEFEFTPNPNSKEVQDFLDKGGKITVLAPESAADAMAKPSGGYFVSTPTLSELVTGEDS